MIAWKQRRERNLSALQLLYNNHVPTLKSLISLASSVVEDLASSCNCIIPISSNTLLAISKSKRLRTDSLGTWTADVEVCFTKMLMVITILHLLNWIPFMWSWTVCWCLTPLVVSAYFERSSVVALQFSTEQFTLGRWLEVVEGAESSVVSESSTPSLFSIIIVSGRSGVICCVSSLHRHSRVEIGWTLNVCRSSTCIGTDTSNCWTAELNRPKMAGCN